MTLALRRSSEVTSKLFFAMLFHSRICQNSFHEKTLKIALVRQ